MPKRLHPVRTYLLAFSAAILLPVLAFASVLLWHFATSERARYEQEARLTAQRLIAAVDLELSRMLVASQALATFPTLRAQDFEAFHRQALDALRGLVARRPEQARHCCARPHKPTGRQHSTSMGRAPAQRE